MIIYKNLNIHKKHRHSVIAIGNFDGIHLGHQKVLKHARQKAKKKKLKFGLVTFEPIPVMFFNKKIKSHRINNIYQKKSYLKKLNLDFLIIINFNKSFSKLSAKEFIKKIIFMKLNSKYVFVSKNFKFGNKRLGNIKTLKNYEKNYSYKVIITPPLKKSKKIISSTLIRRNILKGNFGRVKNLLGRNWCVEGEVIKGLQRGRKMGFPTCNLKLNNYIVPRLGVYSVIVKTNSFKRRGIANIGYRPTFQGRNLLLEVNIFGINVNLYKKIIKVEFTKFIRAEKFFKGITQLKQQIEKDIIIAKK